jgi:hypothetical protein
MPTTTRKTSSRERVNYGREMYGEFCRQIASSTLFEGIFTYLKSAKWDRWHYFPSEGRHVEEFYALKKSDVFGRVRTRELWYQRWFGLVSNI